MNVGVSFRFALLDQQLVDSTGRLFGRVDDVELEGARLRVTRLLTGAQALGERLGGTSGAVLAATARRLRSDPGPTQIDAALVVKLEPFVKLSVPLRELDDVAGLERALATELIEPAPEGGDARL
jgi:hypothetical protein